MAKPSYVSRSPPDKSVTKTTESLDQSFLLLMESQDEIVVSRHDQRPHWNSEPPTAPDDSFAAYNLSGTTTPVPNRPRSSSERSGSAPRPTKTFTFIAQTPNEAIPRGQVTVIRKAVMKDYLETNNGDKRFKRSKRRVPISPYASMSTISIAGSGSVRTKRHSRVHSRQKSASVDSKPDLASLIAIPHDDYVRSKEQEERMQVWAQVIRMLTGSVYHRSSHGRPDSTSLDITRLGSGLNEFRLDDQEVEKIRVQCNACIAWTDASQQWLSVLLRSRDAFYSTLCVSVTHKELIERGFGFHPGDIMSSAVIRSRIVEMISESINQAAEDDGQLVSILQIMYSELMCGNDDAVRVHRLGIDNLVQAKKGLANLDVGGVPALVLVSTLYMADCILETSTPEMYVSYAKTQITEPPPTEDEFLDCPIYAAGSYHLDDQSTYFLQLCRRATSAFYTIHDLRDSRHARSVRVATEDLTQCHHALLACSMIQITDKESALCEAIRIACSIFVHALRLCIPISRAADDLQLLAASGADGQAREHILDRFKDALKMSPLENRWASKEKILLWCGLVALTAANRLNRDGRTAFEGEISGTARDFIAAVTFHAAIFQLFGRPKGLLGMLKRFVAIQEALNQ